MFEYKEGKLLKDGKPYTGFYNNQNWEQGALVDGQAPANDQTSAIVTAILAGFGAGDTGNKEQTTTTKELLKLTPDAAKALLAEAADAAQFQGKLTKAQIQDFIDKFNIEAAKQTETAIRTVRTQVTPGTKPEDVKKIVDSYVTTNVLSFFNPKKLAQDYVWSLVNFKDETTLGGKSLSALQDVRALVRNNGILDISETEIQNAAKKIAMGDMSLDDFNATLRPKILLNYPQFTDRFNNNPNASVRDIFDPYLTTMAKVLGIDKESISLDNPYLDKALRPDGAAGKLPPMSIADFTRMLKDTPEWENTLEAGQLAQSAATGLARAWGFGV